MWLHAPQFRGSDAVDTHALPHAVVPLAQVNPHWVPLQVAVALGGAGHAVHEVVPQLAVLVFDEQVPLQLWKPLLQVKPHWAPSQVAVELAGGVHAVQDVVPQLLMLVLETHAVPHR